MLEWLSITKWPRVVCISDAIGRLVPNLPIAVTEDLPWGIRTGDRIGWKVER